MDIPITVSSILLGMFLALPAATRIPQCHTVTGGIDGSGPDGRVAATPLWGCISHADMTCTSEGKFLTLQNTSSDVGLTWSSATMKIAGQEIAPKKRGFEAIPNRNTESREPIEVTVEFCK